jgi:hypothetical protein
MGVPLEVRAGSALQKVLPTLSIERFAAVETYSGLER